MRSVQEDKLTIPETLHGWIPLNIDKRKREMIHAFVSMCIVVGVYKTRNWTFITNHILLEGHKDNDAKPKSIAFVLDRIEMEH